MEVSRVMKKTLIELIKQNKRLDNRKLDEFRDINVTLNVSKKSEGSAMVEIGKTKVIAGVKIDIATPFQDSPDEGILIVNAEFLPLAYSEFEAGPPGTEAIELARIVDRGIRESNFIDLKKLCLEKDKWVYEIFIDIYILNHDGNLIDASFLASVAALLNAFLPKIEKKDDGYKVIYGEKTNEKIPLKEEIPCLITAYKLGDIIFFDPNLIEENASEALVSVVYTFNKESRIHALQKLGEGIIDEKEIEEILARSEIIGRNLIKNFLSKIKNL
ncbi:MAG: exosome complex protein Rrp42 [Candidatus Pacearchaeota archaeon]